MGATVFPWLVSLALLAADDAKPTAPMSDWKPVKLVALRDFDDLVVTIDGKERTAFLIGLKPLRELELTPERREETRKQALTELEKSDLSCRVVTEQKEKLGISLDAFAHHRNGFTHEWQLEKYPWCGTGWGAYNYNLYFLHQQLTTHEANYGDSPYWRDLFAKVAPKKATEPYDGKAECPFSRCSVQELWRLRR